MLCNYVVFFSKNLLPVDHTMIMVDYDCYYLCFLGGFILLVSVKNNCMDISTINSIVKNYLRFNTKYEPSK